MKKIILALLLLTFLFCSLSFAQTLVNPGYVGVGTRYIGMGGTGIALCDDICAAYFNPAGLTRSKVKAGEVKIALGGAYEGIDKLIAGASAGDPATFLADNFTENLNINGNVSGIIGINVAKIGISVLPVASLAVNKPANTVQGTFSGGLDYAAVLTLGKTMTIPFIPIGELNGGINIKMLNGTGGSVTMATPINGSETTYNGSGFGLDLGAQASTSIPGLTEVTFGIVARNLLQSVNYSLNSANLTYNAGTGDFTKSGQTSATSNLAYPTVYGAGIAGKIPGLGSTLASDIEMISSQNYSTTNLHFGIEQPLIPFLLTGRAGIISGQDVAMTTLGASINLLMQIEAAMIMDSKNATNNSIVIETGMAF